VGCSGAAGMIQMMAAYVGLNPKKDIKIVIDASGKALEEFVEGKLDAYMGLPPEPQLLHARGFRQPIVRTAVDLPWSQYFCCALAGNREFVAKKPVATKRVVRAVLKAADLCASEPMRAARFLVDRGFTTNIDYASETLKENLYGWCGRSAKAGSPFCPSPLVDSREPDTAIRISWREPSARRGYSACG
jgi:NitT/TauT family transport system substrate-binding protein